MAGILEKLYGRLPVLGQNLMVSGQGLLYKRARFGGKFWDNLTRVEADGALSADQLRELQLSKLKNFVAYAYENSPYYREKYDACGIKPADLGSLSDLKKFPVLEKEELRKHTAEIQSLPTMSQKNLQWVSTSGTTGSPITIALTASDMQERFAYLYRMLRHFGIEPFDSSVRLSGRTICGEADSVFWRYNWPQNQMLMSTYHLTARNLDRYVEQLVRFQPVLIDGYPSAIFILARHMNKTGQSGALSPKLIMMTAETLEDFQRDEIQQAFPVTYIANQYASSEGAPFVTEDRHGDLLINIDTGVIEADDTDETVTNGDMLVTSFTTHAFPLIRYRIGDRIKIEDKKLGKSMAMPVAKSILGRQEDLIISPDRGPIGRLDPVFKKMPSTVTESQIEQITASGIVLRVVPDVASGFNEAQMDSVISELHKRLGTMGIKLEIVEQLPRGKNGKLRAVVGMPQNKL